MYYSGFNRIKPIPPGKAAFFNAALISKPKHTAWFLDASDLSVSKKIS